MTKTSSPCPSRRRATPSPAPDIQAGDICAVWVGSESHPYAVKPSSTVVAESLGATPAVLAADLEFACKAGTEAVQASIGIIGSGMGRYTLAIGMDTAQGRPGDELEYTAASGGAAFLLGPAEAGLRPLPGQHQLRYRYARLLAARRPTLSQPRGPLHRRNRPISTTASTPAARSWSVWGPRPATTPGRSFTNPTSSFPQRAARSLGFSPDQVSVGLLAGDVGNTYSGSCMLGLTAILDVAGPGDRILMVSYGSGAGSDAFDLEVTERLAEMRRQGARPPATTSPGAAKSITQPTRASAAN